MAKQNRNYILTVQPRADQDSYIEIAPPFTIEMDIKRDTFSSSNIGSIRVYNLSEKTRGQIRKNSADVDQIMRVKLEAGYGNNLAMIFNGNISSAWSVREGVNMITQIEAFDAGYAFANAFTNQQFPANTDQRTIIKNFVDSMSIFGVQAGAIGNFDGKIPRGNSFSGPTTQLLTELTGGAFFIDNGKANVLGTDEYIESDTLVISAKTGLLATPLRQGLFVYFDMLFEPQIQVGHRIKLESATEKSVNGYYKVSSVAHRGMISNAVGGSVITSVGLYAPKELIAVTPESR